MNMRLGTTHIVTDSDRDLPAGKGNLAVQFPVSHCNDWDSPTSHVLRKLQIKRFKIKKDQKSVTIIRKSRGKYSYKVYLKPVD